MVLLCMSHTYSKEFYFVTQLHGGKEPSELSQLSAAPSLYIPPIKIHSEKGIIWFSCCASFVFLENYLFPHENTKKKVFSPLQAVISDKNTKQ